MPAHTLPPEIESINIQGEQRHYSEAYMPCQSRRHCVSGAWEYGLPGHWQTESRAPRACLPAGDLWWCAQCARGGCSRRGGGAHEEARTFLDAMRQEAYHMINQVE